MVNVHSEDNTQVVNVVPVNNIQNIPVTPTSDVSSVAASNDRPKYYSDLAQHYAELAEGYADNADTSADNALISANSADTSADNAEVWAEGTDEEVEALGGTHSSKGWVDYVIENAPTASVEQTETGATITITDINGTTTASVLNGADGQNGTDGQDGYSPIATVSKSNDTATITITDKNGTTTASISDGANGQDGQDGYSPTATVTKTGNVATITLTDKNGTTTTQISDGGGASRNFGEIVTSTIPLTDAGLHLLDGTLLPYGVYKEFIDYIADLYAENPSANYFTTEAEWQTAVTTYGVCGKFVYDSVNNTVRLPKYNSKIYTGGGTAPVVGNGMALGLTNGTQFFGIGSAGDNSRLFATLGIYDTPVGTDNFTNFPNPNKSFGITSDSTKSGIIANLSNITTSLDGYYYIVVATSTKTDIQVDIDNIATDLNGKADVDLTNMNPSQTAKETITIWGMPDYTAPVSRSTSTYTEQTNGYIILDYTSNTFSEFEITINGTSFRFYQGYSSVDYNHCNVGVVPIPKNVQYQITKIANCRVRYFPCIGG